MMSPAPLPLLVYLGFAVFAGLLALCCAGWLVPDACHGERPAPAGVECAF